MERTQARYYPRVPLQYWNSGAGNAAGAISHQVLVVAHGVLKAMLLTKVKSALASLLLFGCLSSGFIVGNQLLKADPQEGKKVDQRLPDVREQDKPREARRDHPKEPPAKPKIDSLPPGALVRFGSLPFRNGSVWSSAMMASPYR